MVERHPERSGQHYQVLLGTDVPSVVQLHEDLRHRGGPQIACTVIFRPHDSRNAAGDRWFDVLRAELAAKQRDAVFERIEGADHGLDLPNQQVPAGLEAVFGRVVDWFLGDVAK